MTGFDDYLRRAKVFDWYLHYIDYRMLKDKVQFFALRRKRWKKVLNGDTNAAASSSPELLVLHVPTDNSYVELVPDDHNIKNPEKVLIALQKIELQDFSRIIDDEIAKAASFYQEQVASVNQLLLTGDMAEVANHTLDMFHFVAVNIVTLRQILLRYDGFCRTFGASSVMSEWDCQRRAQEKKYEREEAEVVSFNNSNHPSILTLFDLEPLARLESTITLYYLSRQEPESERYQYAYQHFIRQYEQFRRVLDSSLTSVERAIGGHVVFRDRIMITLRQYFLIGSFRDSLNLEPQYLAGILKGRHLKQEMECLCKWRETKTVSSDVLEQENPHIFPLASAESSSMLLQLEPNNIWPLVLNLISCFLYMMNNYIIEPSSAYYANALGSNDAMAGVMLGLAPWFALVSAIGYSYWTNACYKKPVVFSAFLLMIGNYLYSHAYFYKSMTMCLIGRAITGLGAPRVINRRYVADATPFKLRTAASAAFAMAASLGLASGPAMAIVLDRINPFQFQILWSDVHYWNGMTGPGYFMSICWGVYALLCLLTFSEPQRSGLQELKNREIVANSSYNDDSEWIRPADSNVSADSFGTSIAASASTSSHSRDYITRNSNQNNGFIHRVQAICCTSNSGPYLSRMTKATAVCMTDIFIKRWVLECLVGSASILTKNRYEWSIANVGALHLANGLIVIPVSILAGYLSQYYQDRFLATRFLVITVVGMVIILDVTDFYSDSNVQITSWLSVGPYRYSLGTVIAFSGIQAGESFVASLMSKMVPSTLAEGTFNSGLLATLVGTSGQAIADLFITLMGLCSIENLLNLMVIPSMLLLMMSILLIQRQYSNLAV
eukprot:CAMPEP_0194236798 /NCGR_PEP_ID=MMETSP0158-20130606/3970_1 /TAXON_ID=33649 /ORGANISM="Thalassionema nitzschioides, Strain L26-B" /LENGTH=837 /DNA_ID=CAMNT_0038970649 /DNA_START=297 /DNA_END=2810 /DNA_ORIENTATION=+